MLCTPPRLHATVDGWRRTGSCKDGLLVRSGDAKDGGTVFDEQGPSEWLGGYVSEVVGSGKYDEVNVATV